MTEAEPGAVDQVAAEHGTGWGLMAGAGAVACFAIGFAVGVSGPVSIVSSDAQWGLLIFLLGIPVAVVFGLIAVVSFLVGHFPRFSGSVFLASLVLMGGDIVGAGVGDTANLAGWAEAPAPSFLIPDRHSANATVTVALVGQRAFVATEPEPMGDGLRGQWCTSEPDNVAVYEIETGEIGRLGGYRVRIELWLTDPAGVLARANLHVPRIVVTATDDAGSVLYGRWSGRATVVGRDGTSGTVRFQAVPLQETQPGLSPPATLSGEITWSCGTWQDS
jgi:hypothetical protein